jgi:hypothetical protein
MAGHLMDMLYGDGGSSSGGITQFALPSTRASADAQMPTGDTAYAVELGQTTAHAQSLNGIASRITGQMQNPTTEPFNLHMMLIVGGIIVGLILIHRAFKGSVI